MDAPADEIRHIWWMAGLRLAAWLGTAALIGWFFDHITLALLIALAFYTAGHLVFAYQLHRWLAQPRIEPREGVGVWQEIYTELYRLKQRNRRRKKRLKSIVSEFQASTAALPDGAVVIDGRGRIVWFNNAAAALLALRAGQDNGQRIVNLVRHPRFAEFLASADQVGAPLEVPSPANDTDTLSLRIVPYGNGQRLLVARDISEQKRLESTRRDFVANASHELRTPLTVLRGYLEMMTEEADDSGALATWRMPIREMDAQSARMGRIIDSLLRLARLEGEGLAQAQETIDMPTMIQRLVDGFRKSDEGRHKLTVEVQPRLSLFGRPAEIESVISNLVANALRYTQDGGHIVVRWHSEHGAARLAVSDNGPGIAAEHLPRLTERFYRIDSGRSSSDGGTGLGLAIVKHSLEHHEAELSIDSEPGRGTTFSCVFPGQRLVAADAA
ncbi:phosphate regulon sensor histidine kinase PhoR [Salinisphaera hydrothermalis]|uniref:Phosphate regulon sensor protein PhoR n=1 Tax=Salinisphaera hydrothermalis (strain C41B8) TaxID=1304275 RepID=A0A084IQB2_SALHC|nr:phosphate regulon sensor histidine kinase PhoR [Salinisphaera hydrothermalis]KEZ78896.1 Histidine kinase [Salinisphaera hydrothermalis C41B8]